MNSLPIVLRRGFLRGALCAIALALPAAVPAEKSYPNRTVRLIVPFAPGGPTDILARLVAAGLEQSLGKSFIIENRPGASGNIGTGSVAQAVPDGYTLLITSSALTANPALFNDIPYDPIKDLAPVAELGTSPNVFVAHPVTGIKTMEELVAEAKKNPGVLNIAIPGLGTTPHLAAELLKLRADLDIVNVPFAGAGPSIQAVLGGQTQTASTALPPAQPHIQSGALNGLAVTGSERWSDLPEVPTMVELGYKDFVLETVIPFLAPAGTPQKIIDILAEKTIAVLKQPVVRERARHAGFQVLANGPEELRARIEREVPKYKSLVSEAGIKKQ